MDILSRKGKISAKRLGPIFGVCEKTIRDIWSGRTWSKALNDESIFSEETNEWSNNDADAGTAALFEADDRCMSNNAPEKFRPPYIWSCVSPQTIQSMDQIIALWEAGAADFLPAHHHFVSEKML
mmetsp:Transcript_30742/g.82323  ORF Transcript_30742/g.82323 Transcript_30742/m.82323 type:complete len:125 (+) Transcript_30742:377-751(+)